LVIIDDVLLGMSRAEARYLKELAGGGGDKLLLAKRPREDGNGDKKEEQQQQEEKNSSPPEEKDEPQQKFMDGWAEEWEHWVATLNGFSILGKKSSGTTGKKTYATVGEASNKNGGTLKSSKKSGDARSEERKSKKDRTQGKKKNKKKDGNETEETQVEENNQGLGGSAIESQSPVSAASSETGSADSKPEPEPEATVESDPSSSSSLEESLRVLERVAEDFFGALLDLTVLLADHQHESAKRRRVESDISIADLKRFVVSEDKSGPRVRLSALPGSDGDVTLSADGGVAFLFLLATGRKRCAQHLGGTPPCRFRFPDVSHCVVHAQAGEQELQSPVHAPRLTLFVSVLQQPLFPPSR